MELSKRQKKILKKLAERPQGDALNRAELKTSFNFMQDMWLMKLVDGYAHKDDRGWGNYPHTNFWFITKAGRAAIAETSGTLRAKVAPQVSTNAENSPIAPQQAVNAGET